jgi:selenocysteine-specific elongation factor
LNKEEFKRGMLLSDKLIEPTTLLDAKVNLFNNIKKIHVWSDVIFLSGTFKNQAKMHLMDMEKAESGDSVIAQFHLSEPCVILNGDKFIIRNTSGVQTLGGGKVIDPYPLHHRRRTDKVINQLKKIADSNINEFIFSEVRKRREPVSFKKMNDEILLQNEIDETTLYPLPEDIASVNANSETYLMLNANKEKIIANVLKNIGNYHKRNPLLEKGRTVEELVGIVSKNSNQTSEVVLKSILQGLAAEKKLKMVGNTWSLFNHSVVVDDNKHKQIIFVEDYFKNSNLHTPLLADLIPSAKRKGIDENKLHQILNMLVSDNKLYRIEENYIHFSIVDDCKKKLLKHLNSHSDGITVAGFRDLVKGNRKICLLMLKLFDTEGITFRDEDVRKITETGKKHLIENG